MKVVPIASANKNLHVASDGWVGALLKKNSMIELPLGMWQPATPPDTIVRGAWLRSTWAGAWFAPKGRCSVCVVRYAGVLERNMTLVDPEDKQAVWRASQIVPSQRVSQMQHTLDVFPIGAAPAPLLEQAYRLTWKWLASTFHVATAQHPTSSSPVARNLTITKAQLEAARLALKERLKLLKEKLDATTKAD